MSLLSFVKQPDVKAKIKSFRPKTTKVSVPIKVSPRSKRYTLVGTAFDYLLRFEIQRLAPHAIARPWVAEHAPDCIWRGDEKETSFYRHLAKDDQGVITPHRSVTTPTYADSLEFEALAKELAGRLREVLDNAKTAHAAYLKNTSPTKEQQENLAAHAIRLAKLEDTSRAGMFNLTIDPRFELADQEDVDDLVAMLAIVPFGSLLHDQVMLLNPIFGDASELVGGADADLITGDAFVDFKVTKESTVKAAYLDQLLGYFLLARKQGSFPE
jgi:hypothetical protein